MTPEEFDLCRDLMTQDELRQYEERERRRYRARWWRVIITMLAVFWLAVVCGVLSAMDFSIWGVM